MTMTMRAQMTLMNTSNQTALTPISGGCIQRSG